MDLNHQPINENGIQYHKASNVKAGIEITLNTEKDYRKLEKMLQKEQVQFHTCELHSENPLKVVLHGVKSPMKK